VEPECIGKAQIRDVHFRVLDRADFHAADLAPWGHFHCVEHMKS
jgi:hypothetical protein